MRRSDRRLTEQQGATAPTAPPRAALQGGPRAAAAPAFQGERGKDAFAGRGNVTTRPPSPNRSRSLAAHPSSCSLEVAVRCFSAAVHLPMLPLPPQSFSRLPQHTKHLNPQHDPKPNWKHRPYPRPHAPLRTNAQSLVHAQEN